MAIFFINVMFWGYLRKERLVLFTFGTVIDYNRGLMHVKYTLALCQYVVFMSIISSIIYICSELVGCSDQQSWWFDADKIFVVSVTT